MQVEPVIVLHGPRSVGKSTLLGRIAGRFGHEVIDLDDPAVRDAVAAGPSFAVGGAAPVFIDEYQHVPAVLDAIKAALNRDSRPGRFVITGSTNYTTIPRAAQSLTGRARILTVPPLSQCELAEPAARAGSDSFLDRLLDDPAGAAAPGPPATTERLGYTARMLDGGFPIPLSRPPESRGAWFGNYVDLVVERDVLDIRRVRQRDVLPRLLRRLASQTGQLVNVANAARAEGLEASVAGDYTRLLEAVFLLHRLPAWGSTLGSRVNVHPKIHLMDTGVGGWLLDLTLEAVTGRSPSALTEAGHLFESFLVNELLTQLGWRSDAVRAGHYRTHDGHEVDLVLQLPGGEVVAVEIKAGERITATDAASLARLRDRLGPRFRGGLVLHTGPHAVELGDRLFAAPAERLWSPHP
jgi:hypothetical protein